MNILDPSETDTNWLDPAFAQRWAEAMASTEDAYGDTDRLKIINPALLFAISRVEGWIKSAGTSGRVRTRTGVDPKAKATGPLLSPLESLDPVALATIALRDEAAQYSALLSEDNRKQLSILDLGCGEGYLGRLLAAHRSVSYRGYDFSPPLIEIAKRLRKGNSQLKYEGHDLEAPTLDCRADVVFLVLVLEQLRDPAPILRRIVASAGPGTLCLAVTLNGHSDRIPLNNDERFPGGAVKRWSVSLPGDCGVGRVNIRSFAELHRLFSDSGLLVHEVAALPEPLAPESPPESESPLLPSEPQPPHRPSPFTLWVLSSAGKFGPPPPASAFASTPLSCLDAGQQRALAAASHTLEVGAGKPILTSATYGGRLFIVMRGTAETYGDSGPRWTFNQGQLFGDLEAGWGKSWDEPYQEPVRGGPSGCDLAVVPEAQVRSLAGDGLHFELFKMLQGRLRQRVWLERVEKADVEYGQSSAVIALSHDSSTPASWYLQDKLLVGAGACIQAARGLLLASFREQSRPCPRSADGRGVVVRLPNTGLEDLNTLMSLGVVSVIGEQFGPNSQETTSAADRLAEMLGLSVKPSDLLAKLGDFRTDSKKWLEEHLGRDDSRAQRVFWLVNFLNHGNSPPHFVIIEDREMLAALATSRGAATQRLLLSRARLFQSHLQETVVGRKVVHPRSLDHYASVKKYWFEALLEFVKRDHEKGQPVVLPSLSAK